MTTNAASRWFYDWGEGWQLDANGRTVLRPGTPLFIIGEYDFDAPPPWRWSGQPDAGLTLPASPDG